MSIKRVRIEKRHRKPAGADNRQVGYGKPPLHSRFQPGQSGNPKGRPKGSRNLTTDVREVLNMLVKVSQNGKAKKVTTQRAMLMRLCEKALSGDIRALERLIALAANHNNAELVENTTTLARDDLTVLDVLAQRVLSGAYSSGHGVDDDENALVSDDDVDGGDEP